MEGDTVTSNRRSACSPCRAWSACIRKPGLPIEVGLGRFGPFVKMGSIFGSLDRDDDLLAIGLNRAVDVIARKMASVRVVGQHPKDRTDIQVKKGRFGPYVQHGQIVANLPKTATMDDITLDEAVALLAERGKQLKPRAGARGRKAAPKSGATKAAAANGAGAKPSVAATKKKTVAKTGEKKTATKKAGATKKAASAKKTAKPASKSRATAGG